MYKKSAIKKISCVLLIVLLCILAACTAPTPIQTEPIQATSQTVPTQADGFSPHQELIATEAKFDMEAAKRVSIPELGLENLAICDMTSSEVYLAEASFGQVFLLGDDRGIKHAMDHYLVVQMGDRVIAKDLLAYEDQCNFAGYIDTRDFDGDGYCEILVQQCVGMIGGCGAYLTRVFDIKNGQLVEIFSSEDLWELQQNKYGFAATLLADNQCKIEHAATGYSQVFPLHADAAAYYADSSAGKTINLEVDSFYEVELNDIDSDEIAEICCTQYSWYASHAEGLGDVKTVWKYNREKAAFEIIRAAFVPYTE